MMQAHNPPDPPPIGRSSQGVEVATRGRLLHISGQVPQAADGTVPDGIEAQCEQAWANVLAWAHVLLGGNFCRLPQGSAAQNGSGEGRPGGR